MRHHNSKAHILNYLRSAQTVLIDAVISWMAPFIEFRPEPVAACGQCPTPRHPNCPLGGQPIEGIVLSGGIALNTLLATAVRRHFGLPVHVAPLPGDTGASVGALFHGIRELPWPGMGLGAKLQVCVRMCCVRLQRGSEWLLKWSSFCWCSRRTLRRCVFSGRTPDVLSGVGCTPGGRAKRVVGRCSALPCTRVAAGPAMP